MKTLIKWSVGSAAAIMAIIVLLSSIYVVDETESAIVLQFGRVVSTTTEAGLYFKTPFVQTVEFIDKRLREWDGDPSDLLTVDKENIEVNTFARWQVVDPRKFFEAVKTESGGQGVLDGVVDAAVKNIISSQALMEVLRNSLRKLKYSAAELEEAETSKNIRVEVGRNKVVEMILAKVRENTGEEYGFRVHTLGVKRMNYVRAVIPKIYDRMRSERMRIANRYESEGRERQEMILGALARDLEQIDSEAYKKATTIRGEADAEAIKIYAEAYGQDPEFYSFQRTLKTYATSLTNKTRLVIGTDGDFFRYLQEFGAAEGGTDQK